MAYDQKTMQHICETVAMATWEKARIRFGDVVGQMPTVKMNARLTSTGGRAMMRTAKNISINPDLVEWMDFSCFLLANNNDEFLSQTVPHECAHFIAMRIYGDENHGKGFYYVMQELGCRPERCHTMKTKRQMERK